jgi:poly-gamma-glutamate synthesis protein (capsule biosynthesis protein)
MRSKMVSRRALLSAVPAAAASAATVRQPPFTLFLCGDVMTGRGIDQVLPHPSKPVLYEEFVRDARGYVRLAEAANGPIERPVAFDTIWGDALAPMRAAALRIVNLETAVTASDDAWPGKGIHYRMHPANVGCLTAAGIDACALANNHVLDWGYAGLAETLATLRAAGIATAGAGADATQAAAPAVLEAGGQRVLLFAYGAGSSGVPGAWAAAADRPGVNRLPDLSAATAAAIGRAIGAVRRAHDLVIVSLHWGGNWGYAIGDDERAFAHALIDAGVDLVHGHSSHHAKAFEVYRQRLILYGCGDFINDYEGIGGYERYRGDLAVAYFVTLTGGRLQRLRLLPFRMRRFRLQRAAAADVEWLRATLNREGRAFGVALAVRDGGLELQPVV